MSTSESTITICCGKLHRVKVTAARLDFEGSVTLDPHLMQAAGIAPFQLVHINSMSNAVHWETYALPGTPGSGEVCLNGCPARLFQPGDQVIILALEQMTKAAAASAEQRVVYVKNDNKSLEVILKSVSGYAVEHKKLKSLSKSIMKSGSLKEKASSTSVKASSSGSSADSRKHH